MRILFFCLLEWSINSFWDLFLLIKSIHHLCSETLLSLIFWTLIDFLAKRRGRKRWPLHSRCIADKSLPTVQVIWFISDYFTCTKLTFSIGRLPSPFKIRVLLTVSSINVSFYLDILVQKLNLSESFMSFKLCLN